MTSKKIKFIKTACLASASLFPILVSAANPALQKLDKISTGGIGPYAQANETTVSEIVGTAVSAFLALLGVIFLALMLYAGYHWMTARGEEEKVEKAKDTIQRAIVGIIIVVGAYAIWGFILDNLILK